MDNAVREKPYTHGLTELRLHAIHSLLQKHDLDLLVITPGSDLAYAVGHFSQPSERPVCLLISRQGGATMVIAGFESRALPDLKGAVDIRTYGETEDPYRLVSEALRSNPLANRVAISDQAWSVVLLGLQGILPEAHCTCASRYVRELRVRKDDGELELLRTAGNRTDKGLIRLLREKLSGLTERQVAKRLRGYLEEEGLERTGAIIASGPNGASPHHSASDRLIGPGDAIVIDCGGTYHGYYSDITRTVIVGEPAAEVQQAYEVVQRSQAAAVAAVRPGVTAGSIDDAARSVIDSASLADAFIHRTGHSVGLDGHEEPYLVAGNPLQLEPGMVFSVEPGVYFSGRFGIRIEDTVAVTPEGVESFNQMTHDLQFVG